MTCTDEVSDGYDVSDADDLTISIEGNSVFDDSASGLDSAIRIGDETQIEVGEDSIINVTEADGFGIRGDNNNFIDNDGTININGIDGRGVKIDDNTTGILPNGAVNGETGSIFANSDGSIAMETGTNSGVATSGLIELLGENTRGISAGSREDLSALANITNNGTINVGGNGGFGIIAGDRWIDGVLDMGIFTPQSAGIRNFQDPMRGVGGDINVTGDNAFGIFAGDTSNEIGNHNSFVANGTNAVIDVTGTDSVGVSLGGNTVTRTFGNAYTSVYSFQNQGLVMGGANAGPLIQIRNFVAGFENRILNTDTGDIFADITNLGTANRGMAILGSDGDDEISNLGDITGDVDLGLGNDTYIHGVDATFQDALSLGDGNNLFENQGLFDAVVTFGEGDQTVENDGTLQTDLNFGAGNDSYTHGVDAVMGNAITFGDGDNTLNNEGAFDSAVSFGTGNDRVNNEGTIQVDLNLGDGDDTYTHGSDAVFDEVLSFGDGDSTFRNDGTFDAIINFGSGTRDITNTGDLSSDLTFSDGDDTVFNSGTFDGDFAVGLGDDLVTNNGSLTGTVDLGDGNDIYRQGPEATTPSMVVGGDGDDVIELSANVSMPTQTFDLNNAEGFETVRLTEAGSFAVDGGWSLDGAESFTGLTEVLAGAILRPLVPTTFAGDLALAENGALSLEIDGVDIPLTVEGTTTITAGGLNLVIADGAAPTEGAPVQVIDAAGGLNGEFGFFRFQTDPVNGVLTPLYEDDAVFIAFDPSLSAITQGTSQRSIAQHFSDINTAGTGVGPFQSFIDTLFALNLEGATNLTPIIDGISPEGYGAQTTVMAEAGRQVSSLLMDRPRECQPGQRNRFGGSKTLLPCHARRFSPWVAGTGSFRKRDGFDDRPEYDANVGGVVFGIDARPVGDLDFTIAIASQQASVDVDGFGESEITMTDLAAHIAWTPGPVRLQLVGSWGHGFHESERRIRANLNPVAAPVDQQSDTDHDSDRATLAAEAGYLVEVGPVSIEPLVGIDWAWINQRTIDEDEAPFGLGLTIPGREDEIGSVSAGLRLTADYHHDRYISERLLWMDGIWRPTLDLRWRQYLEGEERDFNSSFDGAPRETPNFQVSSEEDPGGVEIGAGLSFIPDLANRIQIDFRYDAYVSENTLQHDFVGRIAFGF
ncbi:MAG: autotransporter domain-containing protein [Myxococcota bacterium]